MRKTLFFLLVAIVPLCLLFADENVEISPPLNVMAEVINTTSENIPDNEEVTPVPPALDSVAILGVNKDFTDVADIENSEENAIDSSIDVPVPQDDTTTGDGNEVDTDNNSDDEWYIGKKIYNFRYQGLKNVSASELNKLLDKYINEEFTYELLSQIQDDLYNYNDNFNSISPSADRDDRNRLIIILDLVEKPRVKSIKIDGSTAFSERKIKNTLSLQEGLPFFRGDVTLGESEIVKLYRENGYREATVSSTYQINDETLEVDVGFVVNEGYRSRLQEFVFRGNYSFSDAELLNVMKKADDTLAVSGYYQDEKLSNNVTALRNLYQNSGYIDAVISEPVVEDVSTNVEEDGYRFRVSIEIVEGQQWRIGEVKFSGVEQIDEETLRRFVTTKKGDVFDTSKINSDLDGIAGEYYDNGYIYSGFNTAEEKNEIAGTIDLTYVISEGVQAIVAEITVSGNTKTKDYVFLREVTMEKGEVFSRQKLIKSMQNIYNTTLVSDINYNLTPGEEDGTINVNFVVSESKQMDLTLGLTFGGNNTGFPISFLASISDKNLVGTGMKLSAGVQLTTDYQSVSLSWSDSWVGNKRWSNGVSFQFERSYKTNILQKAEGQPFLFGRNEAFPLGYNSYEEWLSRRGATPPNKYLMTYTMYRFSLGYNTGYTWSFNPGRLTLSGGVNFGLNKVYYDEDAYIPYEYLVWKYRQAWQWSNFLSVSLQWDGRDLVENTTKGYLISQSFTYAGGILGGLSNYIRSNTSVAGYFTIFKIGEGFKPRALVASITSSLGLMLPQWWSCDVDFGKSTGWRWHDPKYGATKSEMLYIDGMMVSRGHDSVYDLALLWDNMFELSFPIVVDIVNIEAFTSITAGAPKIMAGEKVDTTWYGAIGLGVRLKISGFPLGLYLVGNYTVSEGMKGVEWKTGGLFNYIRPVLSISTSLF